MLARLHSDLPFRSQENIHPRPEFDQPHALSLRHLLAQLLIKDDAPRDQSRDLREAHAPSLSFHRHRIALVLRTRYFAARNQKLALLVLYLRDLARDR